MCVHCTGPKYVISMQGKAHAWACMVNYLIVSVSNVEWMTSCICMYTIIIMDAQ